MSEFMYWWVATFGAAAMACGSSQPPSGPQPDHAQHDHAQHDHAQHGHGSHMHRFTNAEEWAKQFDDPARDEWQKPDEVIRAMQLTPSSVVADVGAGTGYFSVRIARVVTQGSVIATDIEPDMVRYLEERAKREGLANMRAVTAGEATSGLAKESVDAILVVDVWHHLGDRVAYARDLAAALRPGGRLLVVDFTMEAHRGPPPQMRLLPEAIIADLSAAGLVAKVSPIALPDQYIVEATRAAR